MPTERWDDGRLDRLAESVEANRVQIEANSRDIAANAQAISQLISAMQNQQDSTNELFAANTQILQAIVQEIRGLRAENRRILTHLFGEQSE